MGIIMGICSGTPTEWLFIHGNLDQIRIWKCWFLKRGENQSTQRKTSRSREENQQQTQPTSHIASSPRFYTEPHQCSSHWAIPSPNQNKEMITKYVRTIFLWTICLAMQASRVYVSFVGCCALWDSKWAPSLWWQPYLRGFIRSQDLGTSPRLLWAQYAFPKMRPQSQTNWNYFSLLSHLARGVYPGIAPLNYSSFLHEN